MSAIFPYWFAGEFDPGRAPRIGRAGFEPPLQKATVVVVDDERLIADTIAEILETGGFEASAFYDADSALRHCRESCPDIVITDYVMPGLNGLQLAHQLRTECSGARVFLLTGQGNIAWMSQQMRELGSEFEILAKPLHPEELLERLKSRKS